MIQRPPRSTLFPYTTLSDLSRRSCIPIRSRIARGAPISVPRIADRKSTRLNSSHVAISYAVFCLKKKRLTFYALRPPVRLPQRCTLQSLPSDVYDTHDVSPC